MEIKMMYDERMKLIKEEIKILQRSLREHNDGELNWDHVGDLGYINQAMKELNEFLNFGKSGK